MAPKTTARTGWLKFIIGFAVSFAIRLIPFRPPNMEPILTTTMPFSKQFGWRGGFSFAFLSILLYDLATNAVGMWTWITAATYGVVGAGAYFYFKNRESSGAHYIGYAILGTLFYDAVTGLSIGPLFFGQSLAEAFFGQIPFTMNHLAGNIVLAATVSPALYQWVVANKRFAANPFTKKAFRAI